MYGLVVKTSFGVWRLSFMSPDFRDGRHILFVMVVYPSVCLSVCLSVTKSCPLCNLKPLKISPWNAIEILTNIRRCAERKNHKSWIYVFSYAPLNFVSSSFCDKIVSAL